MKTKFKFKKVMSIFLMAIMISTVFSAPALAEVEPPVLQSAMVVNNPGQIVHTASGRIKAQSPYSVLYRPFIEALMQISALFMLLTKLL